jgi:hypothetical protein
MLTKLAEIYNRQDIVDVYKYGVFNYLDYFNLLSRFKIDEYRPYQLKIIKRRGYVVNHMDYIAYYVDYSLHRDDDKPAIAYTDGSKSWYQNGKLHRDNDNPSIICSDGTKYWYQNDKRHRDNDKPAVEWADGINLKEWWQNGELHRDNDKPAIEWPNGSKEWWQRSKLIKRSKN